MTGLARKGTEMEYDGQVPRITVRTLPAAFLYVTTFFTVGFGILVVEVAGGIAALLIGAVCALGFLLVTAAVLAGAAIKFCLQGSLRRLARHSHHPAG